MLNTNEFCLCFFTLFLPIVSLTKIQSSSEGVVSYEEYGSNMSITPFKKCRNSPPPPPSTTFDNQHGVPSYIVDLNLPAEKRWMDVVSDFRPQIYRFIETIRKNTDWIFGGEIFRLIDKYLPALSKTLPKEYYQELIGVSEATGLSVGEVTVFNVFYEFNSLCTSIVMEDVNGTIYHGRNLDFGFLLGWDSKNRTWFVTELLRPLIIKVEFQRDSKLVFSSIQFAGYIGILTGIKKNAFAMSVNERFKFNGGVVGIIEWILGRRDQKWNGILTRQVMESANTYQEALNILITPNLVAPVYFILSGNNFGEGCVITRGRDNADVWHIDDKRSPNTWYLVQTNYDHWKKPPAIDDRVVPSVICLELLGRSDPIYTLYNVLSTIPVLNKETVFTAIMEPKTGRTKIWPQDCPDPCWPW